MNRKNLEKRLKTAAEGTVSSLCPQQCIFHFKFKPDFFQGLILNSDVQLQPVQETALEKADF